MAELSKPILARCNDRSVLAKEHPTAGNPDIWFDNKHLTHHNVIGCSFDFFIDWSATPNKVSPTIWIKRVLSPPHSYQSISSDISNILFTEFGVAHLKAISTFCVSFRLECKILIFRDDYDWSDDNSELMFVTITESSVANNSFEFEIIPLSTLKNQIQQYSGGPVVIGHKGLIYGTSRLECALSNTNSLYPGDADLLILDKDYKPISLIEFKKHTLTKDIHQEKLSNWYPNPDKRKYDRLAILQDYLSTQTNSIPFFTLYFPTRPQFKIGILELISGPVGNMKSLIASPFNLPQVSKPETFQPIIEKVLKGIAYHYSNVE